MRRPVFQKTLLVLALVLGQWLGFAHGFKHVGLAGGESTCEMCLYGQGLNDALPSASPHPVFTKAAHEAPALKAIVFVARRLAADYPIRGPPVLLA